MFEQDKPEFSKLVKATLKTYRVEVDADVLRVWWGVLSKFSIDQVRAGFSSFVSSKDSKFPPVPAHIVERIEVAFPDGRPGADEAWALYPHAESESAVITDEMAEAMSVARGLIEAGDMIGARMAFRDAYNRITERNRANGTPVRWFPSLGTDQFKREEALNQAVSVGRLSHDHALSLLPPAGNAKTIDEMLALEDKRAEKNQIDQTKHRERIAKLYAALGKTVD